MSTSQTKESGQSAAEILIAARERIAVPERWTRGSYACDALGRSVLSTVSEAACWCSMGAVHSLRPTRDQRRAAFAYLNEVTGGIARYNDDPRHTHAEVLAAFDRAIELAKAEADQ